MARIDDDPETFKAGEAVTVRGVAMVGWSGLKRVEYWLRPESGQHGNLAGEDPAWKTAEWLPCALDPQPADWGTHLPQGVRPRDLWGFDGDTDKPKQWPLRYSVAAWSVTLANLKPGAYEFRARTVDLNGFAQPEPRPYPKSGRNEVQYKPILVTG
jgi:hypothetical protein